MRQLVEYVTQGNVLQTQDDIPQDIHDQPAHKRKRSDSDLHSGHGPTTHIHIQPNDWVDAPRGLSANV